MHRPAHGRALLTALAVTAFLPGLAQAGNKPEKAKGDNICKREEVTGSIMPRKVCHTREEWAAINAERQKEVDQMHDAGRRAPQIPHQGPG